jgi:hypothetical protein
VGVLAVSPVTVRAFDVTGRPVTEFRSVDTLHLTIPHIEPRTGELLRDVLCHRRRDQDLFRTADQLGQP